MDERNSGRTFSWAMGVKTAAVVVVVATLAAVWYPVTADIKGMMASPDAGNAPTAVSAVDMSSYLPAQFAAPDNVEPQAPTF